MEMIQDDIRARLLQDADVGASRHHRGLGLGLDPVAACRPSARAAVRDLGIAV